MKYSEYDSPFELVMSDIATKVAKQIDEECWQAIQRVGINVDKEKMLTALKHDAERYREAYAKGYETGYTKRDEEIIRCGDCALRYTNKCALHDQAFPINKGSDWFCGDGKREDT